MPRIVFLVLLLFFSCASAHADLVSCTGRVKFVSVEAGPPEATRSQLFYPRVREPELYEEKVEGRPTLIEWEVNMDEETKDAVVHCANNTQGRRVEDVVVPEHIKRCRWQAKELTCQSGTIACGGYAGRVMIEQVRQGELLGTAVPPVSRKKGKVPAFYWTGLDKNKEGGRYVAHCFETVESGTSETLVIPESMKECALVQNRFICTEDPSKHDAFWPKE